jgi:quercetin dioxygenase-like cupin family protein
LRVFELLGDARE